MKCSNCIFNNQNQLSGHILYTSYITALFAASVYFWWNNLKCLQKSYCLGIYALSTLFCAIHFFLYVMLIPAKDEQVLVHNFIQVLFCAYMQYNRRLLKLIAGYDFENSGTVLLSNRTKSQQTKILFVIFNFM